jgi:hypothetical protein
MRSRRDVIIAASTLAAAGAVVKAAAADEPKVVDYLVVQTAKGLTFDSASNTLRLDGVSPVTLFFADRPERVAGNMQTTAFVPFWSQGKDSFKKDPPNADVTYVDGGSMKQAVVELSDPVLDGETLRYTVKSLQGTLPASARDVSVFIDVIGMPWTPLSYAGVARRSYRRAYYR